MPLSKFEKFLPWTGALAGLGFLGQEILSRTAQSGNDDAFAVYRDHHVQNMAAAGFWALMSFGLAGFAVALRGLLRSREGEESSYSGVAHAGALLASAGAAFAASTYWMLEQAVAVKDHAGADSINWVNYAAWIMVSVCLVPMFWGVGLGSLRTRALPKWFAVTTVVFAVCSTLGALHIPPGGIVIYLLLPVWLIAASVLTARASRPAEVAEHMLATA